MKGIIQIKCEITTTLLRNLITICTLNYFNEENKESKMRRNKIFIILSRHFIYDFRIVSKTLNIYQSN